MVFNSLSFAIFLPIVFALYWYAFHKNVKHQNVLLLVSSYFFYACWDWRFLFLLMFSTALDYYTGIKIFSSSEKRRKKLWLWISISINIGFLAVFKYYNFFIESFNALLHGFHVSGQLSALNVILPVGISFYTFHGLSYVIDLHKGRIEPEYNVVRYSLFVSFFPLLVAGPIERATHLLPQLAKARAFDYANAVDGLRQILWGLFKKIVIADGCAEYANLIFNNSSDYSGSTLLLGAFFFTFQIYGDFSGYSDIALGTARLFGISLLQNFSFPYFSRSVAEFWRRWHISLSSWFKDYIYIPLGGSRAGLGAKIRNTFIVFLISGFWHGANWTFVFWGLLNAVFILPSLFLSKERKSNSVIAQGRFFPSFHEGTLMLITFGLTMLTWIFFRATTISEAWNILAEIFSPSLFSMPVYSNMNGSIVVMVWVAFFVVLEWFGREQQYGLQKIGLGLPRFWRLLFYYGLIASIIYYAMDKDAQGFVYFQF